MKDFIRPRGRLRALPVYARVVYSVFLFFTLAALGLTVWLTDEMVGVDLSGLDAFYAGAAGEQAPAGDDSSGAGPVLELPDELVQPAAPEPMALRHLLEVSHFHLFSMPVYLMILSHIFMLSRLGDRTKLLWIGIASLSVAAHMAAPWAARASATGAGLFYGLSGAALGLSFLVMSLLPLVEMWAPAPKQGAH
ncbi:MAG: hypothetical protein OEZ06_11560 [Myxococcales bacterium]|nr:hypothetical protein [Myxococcales bacterium]